MIKIFLSLLASAALIQGVAMAAPACDGRTETPIKATNHYDVYVGGKNIGSHTIEFEKYGPEIEVTSKTLMEVKVLFVSAFKYEYTSKERWCGTVLLDVRSETNSNGKDLRSYAVFSKDGYKVTASVNGAQRETFVERPLIPSNHWNITNLEASALFDTIKAYVFDIGVTQPAKPGDSVFDGQLYKVAGDYEYSTFYDENDHWQGMSFYRNGKHFVEFRCRDCENTLWPDEPTFN